MSRVEQQVERLIGRPLVELGAVDFEVFVDRIAENHWRLVLRVLPRSPPGAAGQTRAREIVGASCAEVTEAATVAIALAVEQNAALESAAAPTPDPAAVAPSAKTDPTALRLGVGGSGVLDSDALPRPAVGAQLELFAGIGLLRVVAVAVVFGSQTIDVGNQGRGGDFQLVLGGLLSCAEPAFGRLRVLGCGGFELGKTLARGVGVRDRRSAGALWQALRAEAGAEWVLGQGVAVSARAGVAVPLTRPEFVLDPGDPVLHRPAGLSGRLGLGLRLER